MTGKIVELEQNTDQWLAYRKEKFNASETPCLFEVGFLKPYQLAQVKFAGKQVFQNKAMQLGQQYETTIRKNVNELTKLNFEPKIVLSTDDERFSASLDGLDIKADTFLEIKFSKHEFDILKETKKPSEKYYLQMQHQFYVSGCAKCFYAVACINESFELDLQVVEISRDDEKIKEIKKAWEKFIKDYTPSGNVDESFCELASEIIETNTLIKTLDKKLSELKEQALAKAKGKELKAYGLTIYKINKKPTYDYKAFISDTKQEIPLKYLKGENKVIWAVKC